MKRVFVCPFNSECVLESFDDFVECMGCVGPDNRFDFQCQLVDDYAYIAFLNNLHRDTEV